MPEYKLNPLNPRPAGSRPAKSRKNQEHTEELSGELNFVPPREQYGYDSGSGSSRSIKTSDDYKKGGLTASKRADGIAKRGKTRGKMVKHG